MTLPALIYLLLMLAAGLGLAGLIGVQLRVVERLLIAVTSGAVMGSAGSYVTALLFGATAGPVLAGPLVVMAGCLVATLLGAPNPVAVWRSALDGAATRWWTHPPVALLSTAAVAAVVWGVIYTHVLYIGADGSLESTFRVVWSDWAQHLTTANSFARSANLPASDPLYNGTTLLYPFLPDFNAGCLEILGMSATAALALPSFLMAVTGTLLVVLLAERLGAKLMVGVLAALICFLGGGLGFTRVVSDACEYHTASSQGLHTDPASLGYNATTAAAMGCNLGQLASHPLTLLQSLGSVPEIVVNQPRTYDGLQEPTATITPIANDQWFTPLEDWWLPQRTLMFGFAMVITALIPVLAALGDPRRQWSAWAFAGVTAGMLPLVHVQTFIALAIGLVVMMIWRWRREWLMSLGVTAVVSAPRLLQMVGGPHGSGSTSYPSVEVGWYTFTGPTGATAGAAVPPVPSWALHAPAPIDWLATAVTDVVAWFEFWISNLGVALPLSLLVVAAVLACRFGRGRLAAAGTWVLRPFPPGLVRLAVSFILVFLVANIVVFQSWPWDNTKLFVYWYLFVGLMVGTLAVHWWHQRRTMVFSVLILLVTLGSGLLDLSRYMPWSTPQSRVAVAGPWPMAGPAEIAFANQLDTLTSQRAVFVTDYTNEHDAATMLLGRSSLLGFTGWLSSYGIVFAQRQSDVDTILAGCGSAAITTASCPVAGLLRQYGVSYVEVDSIGNGQWWASQGLPVVARDTPDGVVVYDVRAITGASQ